MTQTHQKNSGKATKGPKKVVKSTYNGVALPTDMAERRRLRNKLSAKVHRERKKDALEGARQEVFVCDKELTQLKSKLAEVSLTCFASLPFCYSNDTNIIMHHANPNTYFNL
jgi:hypothetical protein